MADQNVLDLNIITERRTITIEGQRYTLKSQGALSLRQQLRFETIGPRVETLIKQATVEPFNPQADQELDDLLREICEMVVEGASAAIGQLTPSQRFLVVSAFIGLPLGRPASPEASPSQTGRSAPLTGAKSSRGSRGSTAATSRRGSTTSRSR